MGLLHPAQLVWLILAAAVPLLYWAVRRRDLDVSSHVIWKQVLAGQSVWRRTQRVLSALVLTGMFVVLAIVLAEPYWTRDRDAARTLVLVLDVANEKDGAQRSALAAIEGMKLYERMAIVAASEPTRVLCPLTDDRVKLRQVVEQSKAPSTPSISSATKLGEWMLAAESNPTLVVCSDSSGSVSKVSEAQLRASQPQADPPGIWLLAVALALCGGEWLLFSRRVTV